ncbi:MAG: hypothetical protein ACRELC_12580, partial [Gemmatimonadota bacterium]
SGALAEPRLSQVERRLDADLGPVWPSSKGTMHSLVAGRYHYIRSADGQELLFDIVSDPWETTDVRDSLPARVVLEFRNTLADLLGFDPARPLTNLSR